MSRDVVPAIIIRSLLGWVSVRQNKITSLFRKCNLQFNGVIIILYSGPGLIHVRLIFFSLFFDISSMGLVVETRASRQTIVSVVKPLLALLNVLVTWCHPFRYLSVLFCPFEMLLISRGNAAFHGTAMMLFKWMSKPWNRITMVNERATSVFT